MKVWRWLWCLESELGNRPPIQKHVVKSSLLLAAVSLAAAPFLNSAVSSLSIARSVAQSESSEASDLSRSLPDPLLEETPAVEASAPLLEEPGTPEADRAAESDAASPDAAATSCAAPVMAPSFDQLVTDTSVAVVEGLGSVLAAQLAARPFPQIHERARLARVPVIMYHDILPEKQVFFDVTPAEFEADLQLIRENGLTPISLDQLVAHLRTGIPLPPKPILLSFDDGYEGHYTYVYPLLKQYGYPGMFGIYTNKVGRTLGRSSLTWEQLREMAADPLVTIASHSISHPPDLRELPDDHLRQEIVESKRILETELGIAIEHFVYPEGNTDERVQRWVQQAGYQSALTMNDEMNLFAGASESLLSIQRVGQSQLETVIQQAYGGPPLPRWGQAFRFDAPFQLNTVTVNEVPLILASGGRPVTIHADSRYQVWEITKHTNAVAAVDGGFFSLEHLDSNVMVGPVLSQNTQTFVPGNVKEIRRIAGRPLVLISPTQVKFIPFDPTQHNTLEGVQAELPNLTDAFVAAAWLVKEGQPQPASSFGNLFDFDAARDRAFWGIDQSGQPVVGVSGDYVDSVTLGEALSQAGLRDAVMLDSGASASLMYQGKSQMSYEPRPVPHVVALVPPQGLAMCRKERAENAEE